LAKTKAAARHPSPAKASKPKNPTGHSASPAPPAPRPAVPAARPVPPVDSAAVEKQQKNYEEAVRLFQAQKYERAAPLFEKVQQGPNRALAHRAGVHASICSRRLHPPELHLKTVEDHYTYAISLINARRLPEAAAHLEKALQMAPQADHVHYALAAAQALQGNASAAFERLKTAIDLQPRNRILARSDPDFAGILEYPPLASLLHVGKAPPPKPA
jgi:tetratricopeptide (TPR) repeat protein